jgi:GR25 family glycosyltransferase involved in LPS biosynthesis
MPGDTPIDGVFYINLDRRTDRRAEIEEELGRLGLPYERFPAIPHPTSGIVGCGYSHLAILKMAKERGYRNVLIFEDDFTLLVPPEECLAQLGRLFASKEEFDVCFLAYNIQRAEPHNDFLQRVVESQTASAYIVNARYYNKLIELYEWAIPLLESTGQHWVYANDQVWKPLQAADRWLAFTTRLGKQRDGYSDNAERYISYNV